MENIELLLAAGVLALCGLAIFRQRRETRRTLDALNRMLDEAMDGTFIESAYDESKLSAVESRMNRYLSAAAASARNLSAEKGKIQELLADLSHQTKTPIANILLYAQLLEAQDLPPEGRESAGALRRQAEKLSFLITSLVKLSRLETGVLALRPAPGPVAPLLEDAAAQFAPAALEKGLTLTVEPGACDALFDPKWTAEALGNLVDNAVKYTPAGGRVRLSLLEYDLFCRIDVADDGIGVAEEEQAKIFTRLYRSAAVGDRPGVGIGLFLTREIAALEGGYLKLRSAPGSGSTFSLFLPAAKRL